jgi:hypothetical protein
MRHPSDSDAEWSEPRIRDLKYLSLFTNHVVSVLVIDSGSLDMSEHSPGGAKFSELIATPLGTVIEHDGGPAMPRLRKGGGIGCETGNWPRRKREKRSAGRMGQCQWPDRGDRTDNGQSFDPGNDRQAIKIGIRRRIRECCRWMDTAEKNLVWKGVGQAVPHGERWKDGFDHFALELLRGTVTLAREDQMCFGKKPKDDNEIG